VRDFCGGCIVLYILFGKARLDYAMVVCRAARHYRPKTYVGKNNSGKTQGANLHERYLEWLAYLSDHAYLRFEE